MATTYREYLFFQTGSVAELITYSKAVLSFSLHGVPQRALLLGRNYFHEGQYGSPESSSMRYKLEVGLPVRFHCHPIAKDKADLVDWYCVVGWRQPLVAEAAAVVGRRGEVLAVTPEAALLEVIVGSEPQRVSLPAAALYSAGRRADRPLPALLSEGDALTVNAARAARPRPDHDWVATLAYKGAPPHNAVPLYASDPVEHLLKACPPSTGPPVPSTDPLDERFFHIFRQFEAAGVPRSGPGEVAAVAARHGWALWRVAPTAYESVLIHRGVVCVAGRSAEARDLRDCFSKGSPVNIIAVRAQEDYPCKWIARAVWERE